MSSLLPAIFIIGSIWCVLLVAIFLAGVIGRTLSLFIIK
jgi:hypothetical protein